MKIYELHVVEIPTNRPMVRAGQNDQIYKTKRRQVGRRRARDPGAPRRPASRCSSARSRSRSPSCSPTELNKAGIKHTVLNAKPEYAEREGEIDRRGGPSRRRHDRDQHGRPRRRHQARRQRRAPDAAGAARQARASARRRVREGVGGGASRASRRRVDRGPPEGDGRRRPVHPRHRAPRVAPDRQPAARPRRPPGRPGRVALLPLGRGRPRAAVRRRPDLPDPRPPRPDRRGRRGGADRGGDALEADRGRPEEGRGAELPDPQARPRVRRRDEPAARDHLRVPRPHPRGRGHVGERARAARRRGRADGEPVHGGRLRRGLGPAGAVHPARADVPGRDRHRRISTPSRSTAPRWSPSCARTSSRHTATARRSSART